MIRHKLQRAITSPRKRKKISKIIAFTRPQSKFELSEKESVILSKLEKKGVVSIPNLFSSKQLNDILCNLNKAELTERYMSFVARLALSGAIILSSFLLAEILTPAMFGEVSFGLFLIKSTPILFFGLNHGLIYYLMNNHEEYIGPFLIFSGLIVVFIGCVVSLFYDAVYGFSILILAPIYLLEPIMKVKKNFLFALLPEALCLISMLGYFLFVKYYYPDLHKSNFLYSLSFSVLIIVFLVRGKVNSAFLNLAKINYLSALTELVKRGQGVYFFNLLFFGFLFLDRWLLQTLYGLEELSSLMLAYQIVLVSSFLIITYNSMAIINIGELIKNPKIDLFEILLRRVIRVLCLNLVLVIFSIVVINIFAQEYTIKFQGLIWLIPCVGFAMILFNVYSSISAFLFFVKKNKKPNFSMICVLIIVPVNYYICDAFEVSFLKTVYLSYFVFGISMFYSIIYTLKEVKNFEK